MVTMMPPGSRPGMMSFATIPTTRPKRIHPRIPIARLLFRQDKEQATGQRASHSLQGSCGHGGGLECAPWALFFGTDVALAATGGKPMATASVDKCVDQLNSLLRGEISAVETYDQAIRKVDDEHVSDATALRAIAQEHGENAQSLRDAIRELGGEADDSSGTWGAWAKTV